MEVLKISSKSNPNSVAGAIAGLIKESTRAEMQAIGAGALNQAIKAVAIARRFCSTSRSRFSMYTCICRSTSRRRGQNRYKVNCRT